MLREIPTFEDGDYTWEKFVETYNANLANGIGNLTSRILKMAVNAGCSAPIPYQSTGQVYWQSNAADESARYIQTFELQKAMEEIWKKIKLCDEFIQKTEPFKTIKTNPEKGKKDIEYLLGELNQIALQLVAFLPQTSEKITGGFKRSKIRKYSKAVSENRISLIPAKAGIQIPDVLLVKFRNDKIFFVLS